jgi:hypothetical protein
MRAVAALMIVCLSACGTSGARASAKRRIRPARRAVRRPHRFLHFPRNMRARELQAEHFADEIVDIADDGRNDFMMRVRERGEEFVDVNREHLERSKIRIATRQWVMERILSNKYGPCHRSW